MPRDTTLSLSTPAEAARPGRPEAEEFSRLLAGFRERLERELEAFLAAKRTAAAAAGPGGSGQLELIDGVGRLAAHGGKRLRPALVYYAYRACGGGDEREAESHPEGHAEGHAISVALATELLHTYLLIHDDIMDHAEVRRGQPAAHARFRDAHRDHALRGDAREFGEAVAILLGDLAHTWAAELAAGAAGGGRRRSDLLACFSAMCEEVIGGQYLELLVAARRGADAAAVKEEDLLEVLRLKSGRYTAERPVQLGAILAGAPAPAVEALCRYGRAIGEAFQLQDDLLGTFGDAERVGKPVGEDLLEGKYTLLVFHALAAASPAQRAALEAVLGHREASRDEVLAARRAIEETGARARVAAMVEERLLAARRALEGLDLEPEGRAFLSGLAGHLRERER